MAENDNKSPHILSASSGLLGFCFIAITTIRSLNVSGATYIDEISGIAIVAFTLSCIFSFLSIRSRRTDRSEIYETVADYIFLAGLLLILALVGLIEFQLL